MSTTNESLPNLWAGFNPEQLTNVRDVNVSPSTPRHPHDLNDDGSVNLLDLTIAGDLFNSGMIDSTFLEAVEATFINVFQGGSQWDTADIEIPLQEGLDETIAVGTGLGNRTVSQSDLGISTGAVGSRRELGRMLETYQARTSLIQSAQRQKAIYTIDRFDGGLNLNKSPRDLAYWEACQMDELTPSKIGRLIRLGDFTSSTTYAMELVGAEQENYGLHYFKWSDSVSDAGVLAQGSPSNYLAYDSGDGGIDLYNFNGGDEVSDVILAQRSDNTCDTSNTSATVTHDDDGGAIKAGMFVTGTGIPTGAYVASITSDTEFELSSAATATNSNTTLTFNAFFNGFKPVYHNADNRLYVSDASFLSLGTYMCGIIDRPSYFPFIHTDGTLKYNVNAGSIEGDPDYFSLLITSQPLYQAAPVAGIQGAGEVCITTNSTGYSSTGTAHQGIYINVKFDDAEVTAVGTGWGGSGQSEAKYYKFFASFLYDNGAETKLTDVTGTNHDDGTDNDDIGGIDTKVTATTDSDGNYQKLIIRQVLIDVGSFTGTDSLSRVHGARFYYTETNSSGNPIGSDKNLFAELDFRYGLKLQSEFGHWNQFENEDADGTTPTSTELQYLQVENASNTGGDASPEGTISINTPPKAFTYYSLNLFHQEELKSDLMWKASTIGNGIAFIGNIKYDGREYPDTMLYSGAGETDAGSVYPMWGTFPVDSNRIDIPGAAGSITAISWTSNRVLQFREHALYVVNVENVLSPLVEGVYQGMGVAGQYAVTPTPFGIAWVNGSGAYAYNNETKQARSLTIGRLDTEDFNADATSKIGYDDRAKMLIIGNHAQKGAGATHAYAYSFVTDSWCTWSTNRGSYTPKSNFAIDHSGYLTGGTRSNGSLLVKKWSAEAQTAVAVDYITKDIDLGKPNLDKRFYTLYISFTGGASQSMSVEFRVNGREGKNLADNWISLGTVNDYTDPYGDSSGTVWNTSGSPVSGDPFLPTAGDGLDSTDTGEQKLAKINLRHLSGSYPADYLKFARSIQLRFSGTAATTFEINDISLVYKEKRIK